jgi:eukaryotic-like serine/threonine-protein kinase
MAKRESCFLILIKMALLLLLLIGALVAGFFFMQKRLNEYFNRGDTLEVPDFRGKHLVQVFKEKPGDLMLEKRDEKFDLRHPKDHVIAQFPEPGTRVRQNKKVFLTISLGSKQVKVPDLLEKTQRETDLALMNAQLIQGHQAYLPFAGVPRDRVVTQSPLPGTPHGLGQGIDLLLSQGNPPGRAPLPSLVGKMLDEAKTNLTAWGLQPGRVLTKRDPSRKKFQVISTLPAPYEQVTAGTVVDLLVSAGEEAGSVASKDLQQFEWVEGAPVAPPPAPVVRPVSAVASPTGSPATAAGGSPLTNGPAVPPRIIIADDGSGGSDSAAGQSTPVVVPPPSTTPSRQISFVMPDGFMPKELKFIQISSQGRQQVYVGTHKPLDLVRVNVPLIPGSKVQIYLNDIPIEERPVNE